MEVQAENGTKNYQLTHSQTFANLPVVLSWNFRPLIIKDIYTCCVRKIS